MLFSGKPILAICRGLAGAECRDWAGPCISIFPAMTTRKRANIQPLRHSSKAVHRFAAVNSSHHQALERLADGIEVEAWSASDGIVEQARLRSHPSPSGCNIIRNEHPLYLPLFADFFDRVRNGRIAIRVVFCRCWMLTVRVGCNIHFECESSATVILLVNPRFDPDRPIRQENLDFGSATKSESFADADGNVAYRVILETGLNEIRHDALVEVSAASDKSRAIRRRSVRRYARAGVSALPSTQPILRFRQAICVCARRSLDIYTTRASACRPSQTGFITTSSIASVREDRTFQPRKSSNEAMVYAATLLIARLRCAERSTYRRDTSLVICPT